MKTGYSRNGYGALYWIGADEPINLVNGKKLLSAACKGGRLDHSYIETDKKGFGKCLNYDIYDSLRGAVLVQRRITIIDKYGNHPQKDYFIISLGGKKVERVENKNKIVKWSKRAKHLGDIIRADRGEIKISLATKSEIGYKAVLKNSAGHYVSVWDNSKWSLGQSRFERATDNHSGGFYYYPTLQMLKSAINTADVFGNKRSHEKIHILKVKIEGRRFEIFGGKHCASKITPLKLMETLF